MRGDLNNPSDNGIIYYLSLNKIELTIFKSLGESGARYVKLSSSTLFIFNTYDVYSCGFCVLKSPLAHYIRPS